MHDCSISIALAMEILQPCTKASISYTHSDCYAFVRTTPIHTKNITFMLLIYMYLGQISHAGGFYEYGILCTRFTCFPMNSFKPIYLYRSGLLHWHWGNHTTYIWYIPMIKVTFFKDGRIRYHTVISDLPQRMIGTMRAWLDTHLQKSMKRCFIIRCFIIRIQLHFVVS